MMIGVVNTYSLYELPRTQMHNESRVRVMYVGIGVGVDIHKKSSRIHIMDDIPYYIMFVCKLSV